jgi:signal transduction histidine kinase/CheY-like chemotaxis protein
MVSDNMNPRQHLQLYLALTFLAAGIVLLQSLYSGYVIHVYHDATTVARSPFQYGYDRTITDTAPEAEAAGLKAGEVLERIEGRDFSGRRLLEQELASSEPGKLLRVKVRDGNGREQFLEVLLRALADGPTSSRQWCLGLVGFILIPWLSLVLGFSVVVLRPRDPRAWVLLGLTTSFSQMLHLPGAEGSIPAAVLLFRVFASSTLGLWLVLFVVFFPEMSEWHRRKPWLRRSALLFLASLSGAILLARILDEYDMALLAPIQREIQALTTLHSWATLGAVVWFFAELGIKTSRARTQDTCRRLKILWISTLVSFAPMFILTVAGILRHRDPLQFSPWLAVPAMLALDLFPCALIYVIVVRKAIEPNLILRQGMQYALARRSIPALRMGLVAALFGILAYRLLDPTMTRADQIKSVVLVGALTVLLDHALTSRVTQWLNRYFFRDEYDVEKLLSTFTNSDFRDPSAIVDVLQRTIADALHVSPTVVYLEENGVYRAHKDLENGVPWASLSSQSALVRCFLNEDRPRLIDWNDPKSPFLRVPQWEAEILRNLDVQMAIPMMGKTRPLGFWLLGPKKSEEPFSRNDLRFLHALSVQASLALENSLLVRSLEREITERERKNAEKEIAEKASKTKSDFIAKMSHELRTPLNAIIGYSEILQEDAVDRGQESFVLDLQKISGAAKHLLSVINSILDISKIEAGKMELYIEPISIEKVVMDTLAIVQPLIAKNENTLRCVLQPNAGTMLADGVKLRQTLFNLLSNAAKFTQKGSIILSVRVEPTGEGDFILIEVSDTGIGMSAEQMSKLMVPFAQADNSIGSKYGGTGLGLAICKHFCQMMGGDITLTSKVGEGSTATVRLPRRVRAENQSEYPPEHALGSAGGHGYRGTVLVIDDDPLTCERIRRGLASAHARVVGARDGPEGLRMARELIPDLITLDVLMDGMDGWKVLAELKRDPLLSDIPVVMLTVTDKENRGMAWGVAEYLRKPSDRSELTAVLGKYLDREEHRGRILVIDEDGIKRRTIKHVLEDRGWEVREAQNIHEAMSCIREDTPEMIFLDPVTPEMDSIRFLSELRKSPALGRIPVIILASQEFTEKEQKSLNFTASQMLECAATELEQVVAGVGHQFTAELHRKEGTRG